MRLPTLALACTLAACASTAPPELPSFERAAPRAVAVPSAAIPVASPATQGADAGWRGNFSGMIGYREFDEDDWEPLEQQIALGLELDMKPRDFPLGVEFGVQGSFDSEDDFEGSGVDLSASVVELYVGPRLTFDVGGDELHPYLGGGVTLMRADVEASQDVGGATITVDDDDTAVAAYAHAGLLFDVSDSFHFGVDVRGVFGADFDYDFGGTPLEADGDYFQVALLLGTHW